jgi:hypothetical protein
MRIGLWHTCSIVLAAVWWGLLGVSWGQELVLVDFSQTQSTVPPGWELLVNKGEARLRLVAEAHGQALQLRSEAASFALQKRERIALQDHPVLVWQWKVTQLPTGGDFRDADTDDQAAQIIVAFSSSRFLSYLWESTVPKGTAGEAPAPPFRRILALVLQSGPQALGTWVTERRNLIQDYTRLFGEAPESMEGLRIQINSQHTRSTAESYWKSIVLTGRSTTALQRPN